MEFIRTTSATDRASEQPALLTRPVDRATLGPPSLSQEVSMPRRTAATGLSVAMLAAAAVMVMVSFATFDGHSIAPKTLKRMPAGEIAVTVITVACVVATHHLAIGVVVGSLTAMVIFAKRVAHLTEVRSSSTSPPPTSGTPRPSPPRCDRDEVRPARQDRRDHRPERPERSPSRQAQRRTGGRPLTIATCPAEDRRLDGRGRGFPVRAPAGALTSMARRPARQASYRDRGGVIAQAAVRMCQQVRAQPL
ncbi:hypothetical protein Spla01_00194 [Streptomyces platensis]|uniref:HPP family protein n=1 Tax=Streptomyces platensis TaxID=58346 RepID=A0ABX3Y6M9_STRPT|nr:hypothetical protein BG653_00131 [Streptomyces platensis]